jgi:hypothetical protein
MVNPDTKEETVLFRRKNSRGKDSRCFFKDWFPYKNFEIQFRLTGMTNQPLHPL